MEDNEAIKDHESSDYLYYVRDTPKIILEKKLKALKHSIVDSG